jgi:hypothetical protein
VILIDLVDLDTLGIDIDVSCLTYFGGKMKTQRGEISAGLMVALVFIGVIVLGALAGVSSYVSAYNYGNNMENQLKAVKSDNKNIYAQYGQKVLEIAQVPDMYAADLVKVTTAAIEGRYGKEGSKATFQWIQEHNPSLDASLYKKIQQVIEAGRTDFENGQRRQIDIRRQYETQLGTFWGGMWLKFAGYPKVDLKEFDIVSTEQADKVFADHKEVGPIKLKQRSE